MRAVMAIYSVEPLACIDPMQTSGATENRYAEDGWN
jgi:hypothetical protein